MSLLRRYDGLGSNGIAPHERSTEEVLGRNLIGDPSCRVDVEKERNGRDKNDKSSSDNAMAFFLFRWCDGCGGNSGGSNKHGEDPMFTEAVVFVFFPGEEQSRYDPSLR